jgi:FKBP-type peptidyl-prolyl cis-trans isomerase
MKIVFVACLLILISCRNSDNVEDKSSDLSKSEWSDELSIDFNQEIHIREELDIQIYLEHHKDLKMSKTESGLRYIIAPGSFGNTKPALEGEIVTLDIKTMLLNTGEICHQTDSIPLRFVLGQSDVPSGLQEGVKLMRVMDKARFILPSYLGGGLLGQDFIPPQAVLIIDAVLLNIES